MEEHPIGLEDHSQGWWPEGGEIRFTREAVQVDSAEEFEESDTMLGEFGEVLVNHVQRWFKHSVEDGGNLRGEERLGMGSANVTT